MKYLTTEQIAETLKVKEATVREWLREGKLKGVKAGMQWRVPETNLNEFLQIAPLTDKE